METHLLKPRLRWPIDIRPQSIDGQEVLVLLCPLGVAEQPLCLIKAVGPLLASLEGQASIEELSARFAPYGVRREMLQQLVSLLDEHLFLAGPRFDGAERLVRSAFREATLRPAALAGLGYAPTAELLSRELAGYLDAHSGPRVLTAGTSSELVALVAPHIDYRRGSTCYAKTYAYLQDCSADTVVVMGTSHQYSRGLFHLSAKDFDTPLGALACDRDFVSDLARGYGDARSFEDEILHRREHSLELQLPFLKYLRPSSSIVPVLVGSLHQSLQSGKLPEEFEPYQAFIETLAKTLLSHSSQGKRIAFIAGVDMAHVGQQFGDQHKLSAAQMLAVRERDQQYLACIEALDKRALFSHIAEDGDARRICGFPTMYTMLDVFERLQLRPRVQRIDYQQAVDYRTDCAVTFAGLAMYSA
jgi:AmmeMemoRadiSam system protein B